MTARRVPIAMGEHYGDRWEIAELVEGHLIDDARVTLPNVGGITDACPFWRQ